MVEELNWAWSLILLLIIWAAAFKDLRSFKIPHIYPGIVIALWVLGAGIELVTNNIDAIDLIWQLAAAIIAFMIGFVLFAMKVMGGGDVKLFAALALWIKFSNLFYLVAMMFILGLVYTILYAAFIYIRHRKQANETVSRKESLSVVRRSKVPYGPAIALGLSAYLAVLWA